MAISVNRAIIVGRVGKDPEARGQNQDIIVFSVATSRSWKDKAGDRQEQTQWHNVVIFNTQAGNFAKGYVRKGDMVYIEGAIETRKYEKDGVDVYTTEIVLRPFESSLQLQSKDGGGDSRSDRNDDRDTGRSNDRSYSRSSTGRDDSRDSGGTNYSRDLDDEIPF